MKKQLLLTGAYGLVGSNICKILERDYPDIQIIKVKADNFSGISARTDDLDYIIHAAGYGQPQLFGKDKLKTIELNTKFTSDLLSCLKKDGKFLFVSTAEVYSGAPSPHKETDIGTTTPQHPRACYIEGKRCGEAICMAYKEQGYDVKIARLALAYGPGTKKGDTRVLNQFIEQALTTGEIQMKDNGSAIRAYCYVDDVVNILLDILFEGKDTVYNVGAYSGLSDQKLSIKELAHRIAQETGAVVIEGDKRLEGSPDTVELNMDKYISEFGVSYTSFAEGLKRTIRWQKQLYGIK